MFNLPVVANPHYEWCFLSDVCFSSFFLPLETSPCLHIQKKWEICNRRPYYEFHFSNHTLIRKNTEKLIQSGKWYSCVYSIYYCRWYKVSKLEKRQKRLKEKTRKRRWSCGAHRFKRSLNPCDKRLEERQAEEWYSILKASNLRVFI